MIDVNSLPVTNIFAVFLILYALWKARSILFGAIVGAIAVKEFHLDLWVGAVITFAVTMFWCSAFECSKKKCIKKDNGEQFTIKIE